MTMRVGALCGCCLAASELVHWWAARSNLPAIAEQTTGPGASVVLVLGFPSRPRGLHPMQRWRAEIAVRSAAPGDLLLFTGGSRKHGRCEADDMADHARDSHGIPEGRLRRERASRSTWQNVQYSLPMLADAATIKIVSSPVHAARGRAYVLAQSPRLASRLRPAADYQLLERPVLKLLTMAYQIALHLGLRPRLPA